MNRMRSLEDAIFKLCIEETDLTVKPIDRSASDLIREANRYKKDMRDAKKKAEELFLGSKEFCPSGDSCTLHYHVDNFKWLEVLSSRIAGGSPLSPQIEKILGVSLDNTPVNLWSKRHVKWQAAAQVVWFNNPEMKKEQVIKQLLSPPLYALLDFEKLNSIDNIDSRFRGIEDQIKLVNPRGRKRGRPPKDRTIPAKILPIPKIFNGSSDQVNGQALCFAVVTVARVLFLLGVNDKQIINHSIIRSYVQLVPSLEIFIHLWVSSALHEY
ncbi:MAG: hypothetical protein JSS10_09440 [Verrucomicrobia bacterium]|nr:hypothetical protein [Verrucomicrobiota bacterium]